MGDDFALGQSRLEIGPRPRFVVDHTHGGRAQAGARGRVQAPGGHGLPGHVRHKLLELAPAGQYGPGVGGGVRLGEDVADRGGLWVLQPVVRAPGVPRCPFLS